MRVSQGGGGAICTVCLVGRVLLVGRPGGMEKPGDDFEQTHNARVSSKDTLFGGVVSRLQVWMGTAADM